MTIQKQASLAVTRLIAAGQQSQADKLTEIIGIASRFVDDVLRGAVKAARGILARVETPTP